MLVVACAPPLRFIAYVSLAFSLKTFLFFSARVGKGLGVYALLVAKPHCALFVPILVVHAFCHRCGRLVAFCAAELIDVRRHHGRLFVRRASVRRQGDQAL